jgi:hypothetical protein
LINALLVDITASAANNPSHYLGTFLRHSLSHVEQLRRYTHILTSLSETFIHSAAYVFIDGFDQTLTDVFTPNNLEAWRSAQIGLVLAAHHLNTENQHIKVFASIRQEAFAGYHCCPANDLRPADKPFFLRELHGNLACRDLNGNWS